MTPQSEIAVFVEILNYLNEDGVVYRRFRRVVGS